MGRSAARRPLRLPGGARHRVFPEFAADENADTVRRCARHARRQATVVFVGIPSLSLALASTHANELKLAIDKGGAHLRHASALLLEKLQAPTMKIQQIVYGSPASTPNLPVGPIAAPLCL
jgi:hypothetical protein